MNIFEQHTDLTGKRDYCLGPNCNYGGPGISCCAAERSLKNQSVRPVPYATTLLTGEDGYIHSQIPDLDTKGIIFDTRSLFVDEVLQTITFVRGCLKEDGSCGLNDSKPWCCQNFPISARGDADTNCPVWWRFVLDESFVQEYRARMKTLLEDGRIPINYFREIERRLSASIEKARAKAASVTEGLNVVVGRVLR